MSGDIICSLADPVGFTFPNPFDRLQANARQFVYDVRRRVTRARSTLVQITTAIVGFGRGKTGRQHGGVAWVLEDAEIKRLLMRLDAPGDSMIRFDMNPSH